MDAKDRQRDERDVVERQKQEVRGRGHDGGVRVAVGSVLFTLLILAARSSGSEKAGTLLNIAYTASALGWILLLSRLPRVSLRSILVAGSVLRLLFILVPPLLSTDVYRYLWDGRVAASGHNPYEAAPSDPHLAPLREAWFGKINHPEIATIYPPHAQALFALSSLVGGLLVWKLLLLLADFGTLLMLSRFGKDGNRTSLAWALCPLVLVEGFWSAHVEIVAVTFVLAALVAHAGKRSSAAGLLAGVAAGIKLVPFAAVPALLGRSDRKWRFLLWLLLALIVPALPFLGKPFMPGLHDYATRWSFNSPLYELLLAGMERSGMADGLKVAWTAVKDPLHLERISPFVYAQLYPEFLTRAVLALTAVLGITWVTARSSSTVSAVAHSLTVLLLCSPAIHPWYWLIVLPFATLLRSAPLLLMSALSPLSYLLYEHPSLRWPMLLICFGAPAVVWFRRNLGPDIPMEGSARRM